MVKTIVFPKSDYTLKECEKWLDENGFKSFELVKQNKNTYTFLASHKVIGGSIWSELVRRYKGLKMAISGVRKNIKPSARKIIGENQSPINRIEIGRRPLGKQYSSIMNMLNKAMNHTPPPFDKLFHLYMICTLENGNVLTIEKNEDINVIKYVPSELEEKMPVNQSLNIPIQEFLDNTKNYMGEHDFYTYDAFSTNCQNFVFSALKANHINVSDEMKNFIMQDVSEVVPSMGKKVAFFLTSLSNRGKTAMEGYGKRGGMIWQLTPEEQRAYIEDKKANRHQKQIGTATYWDKEVAMNERRSKYS